MDPWGSCSFTAPPWVDPIDPILVPRAGDPLQLQAMEMGCGRLGWHLLDPRTGVVWVVRPYRAYHPELQTH
eukprot:295461-Lingulodinium_polyedra.AAC.1